MSIVIDDRKDRILHAILEDYILTAVPVGSKTLEKKYFPELSSATLRNEMSDLTELGFLLQPHVSAGRVPSHSAFRRLAAELLEEPASTGDRTAEAAERLRSHRNQADELIPAAAELLSRETGLTSAVLMPGRQEQRLSRLQLIAFAQGKALLVMITDSGEVRQTVIRVSPRLNEDALYAISKALTRRLAGCTMRNVRELLNSLRQSGEDARVLEGISSLAERIEYQSAGETVAIGGRHSILSCPEFSDIEKARRFLALLEEREQILKLMRQSDAAAIRIGSEIGIDGAEDCALVTVGYDVPGGYRGTVNVIGPARMNYAAVLRSLRTVGSALTRLMEGNE